MNEFAGLLKDAFREWVRDKALRMGAALSFYTAFSLAPLLLLVVAGWGLMFGRTDVQNIIIAQIGQVIGHEGANAISMLIGAAHRPQGGLMASVIGLATLLVGSTGALVELQDGLNRIWNVRESFDVGDLLRQRLLSLALLVAVAFLLLASLVVSAGLNAFENILRIYYPISNLLWHSADILISWGIITLLFAMIYKLLPDTIVLWKEVWAGSAVASFLFTLGKYLVGLYIGKSAITSVYGAAGSFVVLLIWIYYSASLLYYGAEFTKVYSDQYRRQRMVEGRP